jgi:class 3 adenylate cyclase
MGIFRLDEKSYITIKKDGKNIKLIKNERWAEFNSYILGIGDISTKSVSKSVICAFFDLEGFTNFCNQMDPDLVIPVFLKEYLDWFFIQIQNETKIEKYDEGIKIWHDLPLFIKFMGDGLMTLWDISDLKIIDQGNIVVSSLYITRNYIKDFLPKIKKRVVDPPSKLRCGITKGKVYSVGDENDFVGPCINFASRLQKLPGLTFSFSNRGIFVEDAFNEEFKNNFILKAIEARAIGKNELIYILKNEYDEMNEEDRKYYQDV